MAPRSAAESPHPPAPEARLGNQHLEQGPMRWLKNKKEWDGIPEDLWRIGDKLYDLTGFMDKHPGGRQWLEVTRGTDVTEVVEVFHTFDEKLPKIQEKYFVRDCSEIPRLGAKYTFHEDGFYKTLKRKCKPLLKNIGPSWKSLFIQDGLVVSFHVLLLLAAVYSSTVLAAVAGVVLGMSTLCAHNFFHQRDNFRRYYWDISMLSSTEARVEHTLSHHIFTNTYRDYELEGLLPLINFRVDGDKNFAQKHLVPLYFPLVIFISTPIAYMQKLSSGIGIGFGELVPVLQLLCFLTVSSEWSWLSCVGHWLLMHCFSGLWMFGTAGFTTHHDTSVYHAGDHPPEHSDWGLHQLDSTRDTRKTPSLFIVSTTLGDHLMHHFFPTVDQSKLPYLYPLLDETCREFGVDYKFADTMKMIKGTMQQAARTEPSTWAERKVLKEANKASEPYFKPE